jgi:hypothetical protein
MTDRTGFDLVTSRPLSPDARAVAMAAEEAKEKDSAKKPKKPRKDKKEAKP